MREEEDKPKKEIKKATIGIFCDEVNLLKDDGTKQVRRVLTSVFNERRATMDKLDPISVMIVRGGDTQSRELNVETLKTAAEAALFRLSNDDPGSDTARWIKEHGKGKVPFLVRRTPPLDVSNGPGKPTSQKTGIALCLNGTTWEDNIDTDRLKNDFVSELGLVLTEMNMRSLYPRSWEGRQAMTIRTAGKG